MIRAATEADLPLIVGMGARFHAGARLGGVFVPATFWTFAEYLIREEEGAVFLSEGGMIGGMVCPAFWDSTWKIARECFWWAEDGRGMALERAYRDWAMPRADEVRMGYLEGLRASAVLRKLGREGYQMTEAELVLT